MEINWFKLFQLCWRLQIRRIRGDAKATVELFNICAILNSNIKNIEAWLEACSCFDMDYDPVTGIVSDFYESKAEQLWHDLFD